MHANSGESALAASAATPKLAATSARCSLVNASACSANSRSNAARPRSLSPRARHSWARAASQARARLTSATPGSGLQPRGK
jgi:hypothetical protein